MWAIREAALAAWFADRNSSILVDVGLVEAEEDHERQAALPHTGGR
jgi:hypothetical protein